MAVDPNTGRTIYTIDDLISLAKLQAFGPKSNAVLLALFDLKKQKAIIQAISQENEELRGQISKLTLLQSEVEEINIDQIGGIQY